MPLDKLADLVGSTVEYTAPDPLGASDFRYYAVAIGDSNPRYTDEGWAAEHGFGTVTAPPTFVCDTNQYTGLPPDENGYCGHAWPFTREAKKWIRGGHEYNFGRPVRPGDRLVVQWRLEEFRKIVTKDGQEMFMTVSIAKIFDVGGDWLATNREVMFYSD